MVSKPTIAILLNTAEARARVAAGAADELAIREYASSHELLATLDADAAALYVIDAVDPTGRSLAPVVAAIRGDYPTVPVLVYCAVPPMSSCTVVDAVRAGATGLVFRGLDDTAFAMREAIRAARQGSVTRRVYDEVAPHLPVGALPLLRYAITRAGTEPSVSDAAATLGVDRKTLLNWLRDFSDLGPREFLNWTRLAIAVGMLDDPGRTSERVALDMGFASGVAFRNMLQRYAKQSVSEIRATGGVERVLALFIARLRRPDDDGAQIDAASVPVTPIVGIRAASH